MPLERIIMRQTKKLEDELSICQENCDKIGLTYELQYTRRLKKKITSLKNLIKKGEYHE